MRTRHPCNSLQEQCFVPLMIGLLIMLRVMSQQQPDR